MKLKYYIATCLVSAGMLIACQDDFADLNSRPSDISTPNVRFLFTECLVNVEPMDYSAWHYDVPRLASWTQTSVGTGGNTDNFNLITEQGSIGSHVDRLLRMTNEVRYQISQMNEADKAKYGYIEYLLNPLLVMIGMNDSDMYGSRQYSEAERARYTDPPLLLPKYDTQEELIELWVKELDLTINYLTSNKINDALGSQDFIYNGDVAKWAKLANSMKVKLAARLINTNKQRALELVNQAAASPAGLLTSSEDDLIYNRGKNNNHWNNDFPEALANDVLLNFMKKNHDTRLLSVFTKNDFNSIVVQAFLDQNKQLPPYIEENAIIEVNGSKKTFTAWKGDGEPWVRYYGAPLEIGAGQDDANKWIFNPTGTLFTLKTSAGADKTYRALSFRNQEIVKGIYDFTYPDAPDVAPDKDIEQTPWYGIFFSAAEVNLLLAEFKLLGANLPQSAQAYLTEGSRLSAYMYDKAAELNKVPYYNRVSVNDKLDKSIKINSAMVEAMLDNDAFKLTGSVRDQLEKVYIQQYIHYIMNPVDQFVNVRRSGVPMKNSTVLPWQAFDKKLDYTNRIPRRFKVSEPAPTDKLYEITLQAWKDQNYSYGSNNSDPTILNSERVWYDKNAPQFGAGPNVQ
ncbi:SusD/RagB family nutrient-binding outer membrane lipoprotein [Dysgonomonas sp. ZJ709]|uniref:SusD/RagB family nutrient-binding outer membrane lipoprotein n=1 Tax=Dysgonomonas sp. ZJ709 TaxID=2709797 RepID=UPI0013ED4687|nr:SusD/RagB family nutrient-binding outer membrane lipoprotein [Dysgonomonas sp. ZJ709]